MEDLFSARVGTLTLLGIDRQLLDFLALHGEAQLTLNEGNPRSSDLRARSRARRVVPISGSVFGA
jgi:hypothetical protein